jgi:hypothetical protein
VRLAVPPSTKQNYKWCCRDGNIIKLTRNSSLNCTCCISNHYKWLYGWFWLEFFSLLHTFAAYTYGWNWVGTYRPSTLRILPAVFSTIMDVIDLVFPLWTIYLLFSQPLWMLLIWFFRFGLYTWCIPNHYGCYWFGFSA